MKSRGIVTSLVIWLSMFLISCFEITLYQQASEPCLIRNNVVSGICSLWVPAQRSAAWIRGSVIQTRNDSTDNVNNYIVMKLVPDINARECWRLKEGESRIDFDISNKLLLVAIIASIGASILDTGINAAGTKTVASSAHEVEL